MLAQLATRPAPAAPVVDCPENGSPDGEGAAVCVLALEVAAGVVDLTSELVGFARALDRL